jgi:hypothetical protein
MEVLNDGKKFNEYFYVVYFFFAFVCKTLKRAAVASKKRDLVYLDYLIFYVLLSPLSK